MTLAVAGGMYRVPPYAYKYPGYIRRRRRSLAHRRLPHVRSRRRSKQLARAKRTKRDLLDDDLYYDDEAEDYPLPPASNQASLEELMAYLLSLYPSLYEPQQPPRLPDYPGYNWYGRDYPEEGYPDEMSVPEWEEPDYGVEPAWEVPAVDWEGAAVPGWEPAFYPEEVEEEGVPYYPAPAKRQMMSMVPGVRRKRYFFPVNREPYTHWGAFVNTQEKRGSYEDAYRRLRELALVLADARTPDSYSEAFQVNTVESMILYRSFAYPYKT